MSKKTTFVAITPDGGQVFTRASGTMAYTHALMVASMTGDDWGIYSWHTTEANAHKASGGRIRNHYSRIRVVPVEALTLTGKALAAKLAEITVTS